MLFVDIEKRIGDFNLKVCFETADTVLSLLGSSGSGKSMTLKCIAGIEKPDRGRIILDNRILFDSERGIDLPPQKRRVGYLFQQYALFPNMSVMGNIEAAMQLMPKEEREAALTRILAGFKIEDIKDKKPSELSGGQQQRVAIARAIINSPKLLLMDEPTGNLDEENTAVIKNLILTLRKEFGITIIFVTHDPDMAQIAEQVIRLKDGKIESIQEPV